MDDHDQVCTEEAIDYKPIFLRLIIDLEAQPGRRCHEIRLTDTDIRPFTRFVLTHSHYPLDEDIRREALRLGNIVEACKSLGKDMLFSGRRVVFGYPEREAVDEHGNG